MESRNNTKNVIQTIKKRESCKKCVLEHLFATFTDIHLFSISDAGRQQQRCAPSMPRNSNRNNLAGNMSISHLLQHKYRRIIVRYNDLRRAVVSFWLISNMECFVPD